MVPEKKRICLRRVTVCQICCRGWNALLVRVSTFLNRLSDHIENLGRDCFRQRCSDNVSAPASHRAGSGSKKGENFVVAIPLSSNFLLPPSGECHIQRQLWHASDVFVVLCGKRLSLFHIQERPLGGSTQRSQYCGKLLVRIVE